MDEPPPRPSHVIVLFSNKKPSMYPLTTLTLFASLLSSWGVESIRKFIFVFDVTDPIQYPYGVHNLVLEKSKKTKNGFDVQFYHYMNVNNQLITISDDQKVIDFYTVLRLIYEDDRLAEMIGKGVIDPFFKTDESGLLC